MPEAEPVRQSLLLWFYSALGLKYAVLIPFSALVCFVLVLLLVTRGKGVMAAVSLILIVHIPLLIGLFAAIEGGIMSYHLIATSSTSPKPADVAAGISMALAAPYLALLLTAPAYLTAAMGAAIRSFYSSSKNSEQV